MRPRPIKLELISRCGVGGVQVCKMSVCACARLELSATQFLLQCSRTEVEKSSQTPLACVISCIKNHSRAFKSSFLSCTIACNPHAPFNTCTVCIRVKTGFFSRIIALNCHTSSADNSTHVQEFCFVLLFLGNNKQKTSPFTLGGLNTFPLIHMY